MDSFYYIAARRIDVGCKQYRETGEYVPEADGWQNPQMWIKAGHIKKIIGKPPASGTLPPSPSDNKIHSEIEPKANQNVLNKTFLIKKKKAELRKMAADMGLFVDGLKREVIIDAIWEQVQK